MVNDAAGKSVRVTVQPEIPQNLINSTKLRDVMRKELRSKDDTKPVVSKVEKF